MKVTNARILDLIMIINDTGSGNHKFNQYDRPQPGPARTITAAVKKNQIEG